MKFYVKCGNAAAEGRNQERRHILHRMVRKGLSEKVTLSTRLEGIKSLPIYVIPQEREIFMGLWSLVITVY